MKRDEKLWRECEEYVAGVRGSYDAPGFDFCVKCEYDKRVSKSKEQVTELATKRFI